MRSFAIDALREYHEVARPHEALEARIGDVARRGLALLRADAVLVALIAAQRPADP